MDRVIYNKLVRDRIPEICETDGKVAITRILTPEEYEALLVEKLREETEEYIESRTLEELADIMEVIHGIVQTKGKTIGDIEAIRLEKKEKRGGFDKRILLVETRKKP